MYIKVYPIKTGIQLYIYIYKIHSYILNLFLNSKYIHIYISKIYKNAMILYNF